MTPFASAAPKNDPRQVHRRPLEGHRLNSIWKFRPQLHWLRLRGCLLVDSSKSVTPVLGVGLRCHMVAMNKSGDFDVVERSEPGINRVPDLAIACRRRVNSVALPDDLQFCMSVR